VGLAGVTPAQKHRSQYIINHGLTLNLSKTPINPPLCQRNGQLTDYTVITGLFPEKTLKKMKSTLREFTQKLSSRLTFQTYTFLYETKKEILKL